ncbi:MAG: aspartyl protease family protein [Arenicella sp.]
MRWIGFIVLISLTVISLLEPRVVEAKDAEAKRVAAGEAVAAKAVAAKTVAAIALFNDRAMLSVDGKKAKIIRAGSTYKGVNVISSNTSEAVIEIDGKRKTLRLNGTAVIGGSLGASSKRTATSIVLYENEVGFFEAGGLVNGRSIRFLVDTGANLVVFNSRQATRLGINYLSGERGFASTASGVAPMYTLNIDSISVGGLELKDIKAGVIEGGFPEIPLLGMTFLSRLHMNRAGQTMVLKKP